MAKHQGVVNVNNCRSYATPANLATAMVKLPEAWRFVMAYNDKGRVTPIFLLNSLQGDVAGPAQMGFMVVG